MLMLTTLHHFVIITNFHSNYVTLSYVVKVSPERGWYPLAAGKAGNGKWDGNKKWDRKCRNGNLCKKLQRQDDCLYRDLIPKHLQGWLGAHGNLVHGLRSTWTLTFTYSLVMWHSSQHFGISFRNRYTCPLWLSIVTVISHHSLALWR